MNIGSNAGPFKVSPTIPKVVTPTLCETNDKSLSDVYTPGETKTLFDVAMFILNVFKNLFIDKYCHFNQKLMGLLTIYESVGINSTFFLPWKLRI
jgi:hypothetical protein